jgi:hypothetical protein
MISRKRVSWRRVPLNLWQASLEAQQVIGLRLLLMTRGSKAATAEIARMIPEKVSATLEVQQAAAFAILNGRTGVVPSQALSIYRKKMRANRRRLRAAGKPPKMRPASRISKSRPT